MAVRTVSVILTADIAAFRARMNDASRTANRTSADIRTSMRNAGRTLNQVSNNQKNALKAVQVASTGLIAAFGFAVAASARFDKAMASVQAVTGATAGEMARLRSSAMEAGRTTKFSAVEAADAQHELAKAGVSVADIAGGAMKGALNLAAAAEIQVAEGAEIAANAMTVFGLKGKDVGHVADVLAAAANKSTTDVHQLGLSLRMTGQVAAQTGLSLEDTVGAMALFAAEGLKGSDAGTSFKVMLQRLTPQSKEAQATMDRLGFSAYDANGNFVGLQEVAARMKTAFANLTPEARNAAMGVIFGSDAVRAAGILYKHGADGVRTYTNAVNDQGYAAAVAQARMNHLIGDLELLKSALETALIESGTAANAALRDMVQWVTRLVNVYNGLPPGLQQTVGLMTGLVGILGLAGASMLLLLPRIMLVRRELQAMGVTAAVVRGQMLTLGKLGLVLGALTAVAWGIDTLGDKLDGAGPSVTKLTNSLVDLAQKGKASGELTKTFGQDLDGFGEAVARIAHPGGLDRLEDFFSTFDPMAEGGPSLEKAREKVSALDDALASLVQSGSTDVAAEAFRAMATEAEANGTSAEKLLTLLPSYAEALAGADTQAKLNAESQGLLGDETAMTADEMADQRSAAEKLTDALNELNGTAISAAEGEINFRDSLDKLNAAVDENGTSLDVTTEKGREVKSAFLDAAKAAQEHAQAVSEQMGSQEAGTAVLEENIAALRAQMKAAGFTEAQIKDLIGTYAQVPPKTETQIIAETKNAMSDLEKVQQKVKGTKGKSVTVKTLTKEGERALEQLGYKIKRTKGKSVTITVPTGSQKANVDALRSAIESLRNKYVTITTAYRVTGSPTVPSGTYYGSTAGRSASGGPVRRRYASGGGVFGFPDGGPVFGPGSSTSDSVPSWLSNGEYVIRAAAVRKYGLGMLDSLNAMRLAGGGPVGYAKGGKAKKPTQSQINARKEVPGDLGALGRALNDSASDIRSAANALITDLKKLGDAGWKLAGQVDKTSRKLQSLAKERDKVSEKIAEAKRYASDQRGSAMDFMALGEGGTAKDLIKDYAAKQKTAAEFQQDIRALEKKGLHKDLLSQVIAEGPGGELADKLLKASPAELSKLNKLAKSGSKLATGIGRTAADAMYDAGKNASKGFLQGLISEEKALQKEMDKLGESLIEAIKKALKIKSPSQRARDEVGKMFGRGVSQGLDLSIVDVQASAHRMSAAAVNAAYMPATAPGASTPAGGQFTGTLYLESGQFLGAVRGTVQPMIRESENRQAYRAKVGRR